MRAEDPTCTKLMAMIEASPRPRREWLSIVCALHELPSLDLVHMADYIASLPSATRCRTRNTWNNILVVDAAARGIAVPRMPGGRGGRPKVGERATDWAPLPVLRAIATLADLSIQRGLSLLVLAKARKRNWRRLRRPTPDLFEMVLERRRRGGAKCNMHSFSHYHQFQPAARAAYATIMAWNECKAAEDPFLPIRPGSAIRVSWSLLRQSLLQRLGRGPAKSLDKQDDGGGSGGTGEEE